MNVHYRDLDGDSLLRINKIVFHEESVDVNLLDGVNVIDVTRKGKIQDFSQLVLLALTQDISVRTRLLIELIKEEHYLNLYV